MGVAMFDSDKTRVVSAAEMARILAGLEVDDDAQTIPYIRTSIPPAPQDDTQDLWPDDEYTSTELAWFL